MDFLRSGKALECRILPDVALLLKRPTCLLAVAAILLAAPLSVLAQSFAAQPPVSAGRPVAARVATALPLRIEQALHAQDGEGEGAASPLSDVVRLFYYDRGYRPVWTSAARTGELIAAIEASREHGLTPADFAIDSLREAAARGGDDAQEVVRRDLLFTDAAARLARQLRYGKVDPSRLHSTWNFSPLPGVRERAQMLAALLEADSLSVALAALAPQDEAYLGLQKALSRYTVLAAEGGWPSVPAGPTLRPGERDARVRALRARLQAEGWSDADGQRAARSDPARYDQMLAAAVKRFQHAQGLSADAAVGVGTLTALNVSAAERLAQIRVNLERQRWVARDMTVDRLLVDIAGFNAELVVGGELLWSSNVVVGRPERETPVLLDEVRHLVLNPKWVVPPTILREDVIPKVMVNAAYLDQQRMRVVDNRGQAVAVAQVDWKGASRTGFPYQIVQQSGGDGALGRIKFSLSNGYSIYLHDTPSRAQFRKPVRALSSGCVRLEKPRDLALLLLDDPQRWSEQTLAAEIDKRRTQTLAVGLYVPVMLLYRTAVADSDATGAVSFRKDIYGHDQPVLALLDATGSSRP